MKINITIFLIALGLGAYAMNSYNTSPRPSKIKVKDKETISQIFSSGCEVGVMKHCDPKDIQACREYCIMFVENHPKVMELLLEGLEKNVP